MKSYMLGLYEKSMPNSLTMSEKLATTKECGYDYLELSIDETDDKLNRLQWSDSEIKELINLQFEHKMPIKSICLSGHRKYPLGDPDEKVQKRSLEIMEDAIKLACKLGVRIIQIAGYDVYYKTSTEETKAIFEKNLRKSVEIASKYGVTLAFETMETDFLNTVEKAMYWVNKIDSPWLKVYPDSGNITNSALLNGTSVIDDLRLGKGHISALHLKESEPNIFREVPYGSGHVDFKSIIQEAYQSGVRMYVAEFWDVGLENWKNIIIENRKFLEKNLNS